MSNEHVLAAAEGLPATSPIDLEGTLNIALGLVDAIAELSADQRNAGRRLGAVCAIAASLETQIKEARELVDRIGQQG